MRSEYFQTERQCEDCGVPFWSTAAGRYCSKACRQRGWRALRGRTRSSKSTLPELCSQLLEQGLPLKVLPQLFRAVARELRKAGWDPIELLMTMPDEGASPTDTAPGGIEGAVPRRRWLMPPDVELEKLEQVIAQRAANGKPVGWYEERREQLIEFLVLRKAAEASAQTQVRR